MMKPELIKAFGVCTTESNAVSEDIKMTLYGEAIARGYLFPISLLNEDMVEFIKSETVDYNSTFYKSWKQMMSKSRVEQFIDQILHYMTTYGTGFQSEFLYTCNDEDRSDVPDIKTYKVIEPATIEEVFTRCINLITSGIAMSNSLVTAVVDYIVEHRDLIPDDFKVDDVANREAMIQLCDHLGIYPKGSIALVRYIVYKTTGDAILIKDKRSINDIKVNASKVDFTKFTDADLTELSKVFFRFKPIFLAFKCYKPNAPVINKLRKLANKNHVPSKAGFWQTILGEKKPIAEVIERVDELNNFQLVSLIQTINERELLVKEGDNNAYIIRNGAIWMDLEGESVKGYDLDYLRTLKEVFYQTLRGRLFLKAGTVKFPKSIDIACPVSEKKFAGTLPYGSAYKMSNHNYFGIYWKESDGTRDFDLSFINKNGQKIGWNASFRNGNDILFSGDMTRANPDASEVIYFRGGAEDMNGVLWCNRFNGDDRSKYCYFLGRQEINDFKLNYMVDPNTVEFEEWTESRSNQEMMGVVMDNKIYPCKFGFGTQYAYASASNGLNSEEQFKIMSRKLRSSLDLKKVLLDAGFTEWKEGMTYVDPETREEKPVIPDYDFTSLDKDTLINLFQD